MDTNYVEAINKLLSELDDKDECFLRQIWIIIKRHIEMKGEVKNEQG